LDAEAWSRGSKGTGLRREEIPARERQRPQGLQMPPMGAGVSTEIINKRTLAGQEPASPRGREAVGLQQGRPAAGRWRSPGQVRPRRPGNSAPAPGRAGGEDRLEGGAAGLALNAQPAAPGHAAGRAPPLTYSARDRRDRQGAQPARRPQARGQRPHLGGQNGSVRHLSPERASSRSGTPE